MLTFDQALTWMKENQLIIGLVLSAVIGTMPETLPSLRQAPQWAWTWCRDAAKTFLNFRRGIEPPIVPITKQEAADTNKVIEKQQLNG